MFYHHNLVLTNLIEKLKPYKYQITELDLSIKTLERETMGRGAVKNKAKKVILFASVKYLVGWINIIVAR